MRLVKPINMTDTVLTSTDVPENEFPAWNSATPYVLDAKVIYNHKVWRALAANTNKNPVTETTTWFDEGSTNQWALFDPLVNSITSKANSFTYTFTVSGVADSLAVLNATATDIHIVVTAPGLGQVLDRHINMVAISGIDNIYSYLFEPIRRLRSRTVIDLPAYLNPTITVTVSNPTSVAKVGCMIIGKQTYLGRTQYGSSVGILDSSKKERDAFGSWKVIERPYSQRGSFNIMVDNGFIDELQWTLSEYRATPILYLGTDEFESTSVFGFYKDFTITIQHANESSCNLEVEGVT